MWLVQTWRSPGYALVVTARSVPLVHVSRSSIHSFWNFDWWRRLEHALKKESSSRAHCIQRSHCMGPVSPSTSSCLTSSAQPTRVLFIACLYTRTWTELKLMHRFIIVEAMHECSGGCGHLKQKERAFSCDALSSLKLSLVTGRDIFWELCSCGAVRRKFLKESVATLGLVSILMTAFMLLSYLCLQVPSWFFFWGSKEQQWWKASLSYQHLKKKKSYNPPLLILLSF